MTATAHAVIGVVIAAKVGNPALAIPLALASHLVADSIPHWDAGTHRREKTPERFFIDSCIDGTSSFIVSFLILHFLFPQTDLIYAFVIIIASQLFDWMMVPYLYLNMHFPPFSWPYKFSKMFDRKLDKPWGIILQVVIVASIVMLGTTF